MTDFILSTCYPVIVVVILLAILYKALRGGKK